jgi:indole-3-glycerol phosphate synthase
VSADILTAIMAAARTSSRHRAQAAGAAMETAAAARQPRGDAFAASLAAPGVRVIAECKRRSPSRGILRADYDPAAIARGYAAAGAAALSVLTESTFFDGALEHLELVRSTVTIPVLRKDFIVDPFQIVEAQAAGADAILLIVAGLDDRALAGLHQTAVDRGLAVLVEVHSREELLRALEAGASIVGVNSRNLKTLDVDLGLHEVLIDEIPDAAIAVAESGLRTAADLHRLRTAGYDAFLVGERLMAAANPGEALTTLLDEPAAEGASS